MPSSWEATRSSCEEVKVEKIAGAACRDVVACDRQKEIEERPVVQQQEEI